MDDEIKDLLNALRNNPKRTVSYTKREIWNMISEKKSWKEMGFSCQEELSNWIEDNPYNY